MNEFDVDDAPYWTGSDEAMSFSYTEEELNALIEDALERWHNR